MKKIVSLNTYFILFILIILGLTCRKGNENIFCKRERIEFRQLVNATAQAIYSYKYKRFGLSIILQNTQNIDSQVVGLVCDLDKDLRNIGTVVEVSGVLKYFDSSENIIPEIGGQDLYYLEIRKIIKK